MSGLRPFRKIPEDLVEWSKWCREQESVIRDTVTVSGSFTFNNSNERTVTVSETGDYAVMIEGNVNETFWITNKTSTSFKVNSSATSSAEVIWILVRL